MSERIPTIAVDFDGVIHPYTKGWVGVIPDDEPPHPSTAPAIRRLACRYKVVVFSARASSDAGADAIWSWLRKHALDRYIVEVTAMKPAAVIYIDDRAIRHTDWTTTMVDVGRAERGLL